MNLIGLITGLVSVLGVALGGYLAYRDSFFTVSQMQRKGFDRGLPWIMHFGMWGDLLVVTPILAIIVGRYHGAWSTYDIVLSIAPCAFVGIIATKLWELSVFPESHTYKHTRPPTGWVHLYYMIGAFTPIVLFYFETPHELISPKLVVTVSAFLTVHIFFGTHTALKIWNPKWFGIAFSLRSLMPTIVVGSILGWRTWAIIAQR